MELVCWGAIAPVALARAAAGSTGGMPVRRLSLVNLHTHERLDCVYYDNGCYLPDALAAADRVLRDHRTGDIHPIAPALLDVVHRLTRRFGGDRPVHIISGYRSPRSNAMLRKRSTGVASKSYHTLGKAIDLRIPGVPLKSLHRAAKALRAGGVGWYPKPDFIHVDIGPVRYW